MFACQPLHRHLRHSCDGYSVARRVVFALTCGLLLLYGAEEAVQAPVSTAPSVQSTAGLWMSADDVRARIDEADAPHATPVPVLKPAPARSTAAVESSSAEADRCLPGPLMPTWTLNCVMIDVQR